VEVPAYHLVACTTVFAQIKFYNDLIRSQGLKQKSAPGYVNVQTLCSRRKKLLSDNTTKNQAVTLIHTKISLISSANAKYF
jgi:hypothetical protein